MNYKAIIFDLDGVICHTDEYHYLAWKALADRLNIGFDRDVNNLLRGVSRMESLEIILRNHNQELSQEVKEVLLIEKNEAYRAKLESMTPDDLDSDVVFTLLKLIASGTRMAIGSSSKNAKFILEKLGIRQLFEVISDGSNIKRSKPDPEVFLMAAKHLGLTPSECLVVEDAPSGVEAALAGGFDCAGVGGALADVEPTFRIKQMNELLAINMNQ